MEMTEAESGVEWLEEEGMNHAEDRVRWERANRARERMLWERVNHAQDRMLWERLFGLFSGIAIGVLMTIFVIGPDVGDRLFWESPWFIVFAVVLGLIILDQLRAIAALKGD